VRGGGHNVAGMAVIDDGLVIDLSPMRGVRIDASGRSVHVQGGATWADVDAVTAPLGLAAPGGVVSETGVAGLALSGGVSHQRRRHGMTVDNLVSARSSSPTAAGSGRAPTSMPTCTGRCAAVAATSASSRPSSCACTSSGPRCSP
jgi:FAD/FMN-containing dehydrogenase